MFVDLTDQIKDGIILHLSESERLTQFLPVGSIYAMQVPANAKKPFLRFGTPICTPYVSSCFKGTTLRVTLDVFVEGGPQVGPGETLAGLLGGLVLERMNTLDLGQGLAVLDNTYLGSRRTSTDAEADAWRSMLEFNVTAVLSAS